MNDSDLEISSKAGKYHVIVRGRANFEYAVPLRNIAKSTGIIEGVAFDLENCTAMDSSFMGVLSMLALRMIREKKGAVELYNAKENLWAWTTRLWFFEKLTERLPSAGKSVLEDRA